MSKSSYSKLNRRQKADSSAAAAATAVKFNNKLAFSLILSFLAVIFLFTAVFSMLPRSYATDALTTIGFNTEDGSDKKGLSLYVSGVGVEKTDDNAYTIESGSYFCVYVINESRICTSVTVEAKCIDDSSADYGNYVSISYKTTVTEDSSGNITTTLGAAVTSSVQHFTTSYSEWYVRETVARDDESVNSMTYIDTTKYDISTLRVSVETKGSYSASDKGKYFGDPYIIDEANDMLALQNILDDAGDAADFARFGFDTTADGFVMTDAIEALQLGYYRVDASFMIYNDNYSGIGSMEYPFAGCFDFNGKTINLGITKTTISATDYADAESADDAYDADFGLFGRVIGNDTDPCLIRNASLKGSIGMNISSVYDDEGNAIDEDSTIAEKLRFHVGGLAGTIGKHTIIDGAVCKVSSSVITPIGSVYCGGFFGFYAGNIDTWSDCSYIGEYSNISAISYAEEAQVYVGGLCGLLKNAYVNNFTFEGLSSHIIANSLADKNGGAIVGGLCGVAYLGGKKSHTSGVVGSDGVSILKSCRISNVNFYLPDGLGITAVVDNANNVDSNLDTGVSYSAIAGGFVGTMYRYVTDVTDDSGNEVIGDNDFTFTFTQIHFYGTDINGSTSSSSGEYGGVLSVSASTLDHESAAPVYAGGAFGYVDSKQDKYISYLTTSDLLSLDIDGDGENEDAISIIRCDTDVVACQNGYGPAYAGGIIAYGVFYITASDAYNLEYNFAITDGTHTMTVLAEQTTTTSKQSVDGVTQRNDICAGFLSAKVDGGHDLSLYSYFVDNATLEAMREIGSTATGNIAAGGFIGILDASTGGTAGTKVDGVTMYMTTDVSIQANQYSYNSVNDRRVVGNIAYCGGFIGLVYTDYGNVEDDTESWTENHASHVVTVNNIAVRYTESKLHRIGDIEYAIKCEQNGEADGGTTRTNGYVGGIFGLLEVTSATGVTFSGVEGDPQYIAILSSQAPNSIAAGGIAGCVVSRGQAVSYSDCTVENAVVYGRAYSSRTGGSIPSDTVGGAFGYVYADNSSSKFSIDKVNVYDTTLITLGEGTIRTFCGGLAGQLGGGSHTVTNCSVIGCSVEADAYQSTVYAGGITGEVGSMCFVIENNYVLETSISAVLQNTSSRYAIASGIIGVINYIDYITKSSIRYNYTNAYISATATSSTTNGSKLAHISGIASIYYANLGTRLDKLFGVISDNFFVAENAFENYTTITNVAGYTLETDGTSLEERFPLASVISSTYSSAYYSGQTAKTTYNSDGTDISSASSQANETIFTPSYLALAEYRSGYATYSSSSSAGSDASGTLENELIIYPDTQENKADSKATSAYIFSQFHSDKTDSLWVALSNEGIATLNYDEDNTTWYVKGESKGITYASIYVKVNGNTYALCSYIVIVVSGNDNQASINAESPTIDGTNGDHIEYPATNYKESDGTYTLFDSSTDSSTKYTYTYVEVDVGVGGEEQAVYFTPDYSTAIEDTTITSSRSAKSRASSKGILTVFADEEDSGGSDTTDVFYGAPSFYTATSCTYVLGTDTSGTTVVTSLTLTGKTSVQRSYFNSTVPLRFLDKSGTETETVGAIVAGVATPYASLSSTTIVIVEYTDGNNNIYGIVMKFNPNTITNLDLTIDKSTAALNTEDVNISGYNYTVYDYAIGDTARLNGVLTWKFTKRASTVMGVSFSRSGQFVFDESSEAANYYNGFTEEELLIVIWEKLSSECTGDSFVFIANGKYPGTKDSTTGWYVSGNIYTDDKGSYVIYTYTGSKPLANGNAGVGSNGYFASYYNAKTDEWRTYQYGKSGTIVRVTDGNNTCIESSGTAAGGNVLLMRKTSDNYLCDGSGNKLFLKTQENSGQYRTTSLTGFYNGSSMQILTCNYNSFTCSLESNGLLKVNSSATVGTYYKITCTASADTSFTKTIYVRVKQPITYSETLSGASFSGQRKAAQGTDFIFTTSALPGYGLALTIALTADIETSGTLAEVGSYALDIPSVDSSGTFAIGDYTISYVYAAATDTFTITLPAAFTSAVQSEFNISLTFKKTYYLIFSYNSNYFTVTVENGTLLSNADMTGFADWVKTYVTRYGMTLEGWYLTDTANTKEEYADSFATMQGNNSVVHGTLIFYPRWTYQIEVTYPSIVEVKSAESNSGKLMDDGITPFNDENGFSFRLILPDTWAGTDSVFSIYLQTDDETKIDLSDYLEEASYENSYKITAENMAKVGSGKIILIVYSDSLDFHVGDVTWYDSTSMYEDSVFTLVYNVNYAENTSYDNAVGDVTFNFTSALPSGTSLRLYYYLSGSYAWSGYYTLSDKATSVSVSSFSNMGTALSYSTLAACRSAKISSSSAFSESFRLVVTLPDNQSNFDLSADSLALTSSVPIFEYTATVYSNSGTTTTAEISGNHEKLATVYPVRKITVTVTESSGTLTYARTAAATVVVDGTSTEVADYRHRSWSYMWRITKSDGTMITADEASLITAFGSAQTTTTTALYYTASTGSIDLNSCGSVSSATSGVYLTVTDSSGNSVNYIISLIATTDIYYPAAGTVIWTSATSSS